jgi:hypothetical protein
MTSREDIERALRDVYAARQRGDLDAIGRIFAPHARFQMAGSNASPVAVRAEGAEQYRPLLAGMMKTFEVLDHQIVSMLIDGSKAAVQARPAPLHDYRRNRGDRSVRSDRDGRWANPIVLRILRHGARRAHDETIGRPSRSSRWPRRRTRVQGLPHMPRA